MRTVLVFSVLSATLLACSAPATREATERDSATDVASSDGGAIDVRDGSVAPTSLRAHDAGAGSVTLPARDAGARDASTHDASRDAQQSTVDAGQPDAGERSDGSVDAGDPDAGAPAVDAGVDASSDDAGPTVPACSGAVAASLCVPVVQCSDRFVCSQSGGYGCCEAMQVPFCKCN